MEDLDQELESEVVEPIETEETVEGAAAPEPAAAEPEATEEAEGQAGAEAGEAEREELEAEEAAEGEEEEEASEHTPNLKFKAGVFNKETKDIDQKEYEIDPRFAAIMKTPEDEKLVQELHQKAYGLESVKDRLADTRVALQSTVEENEEIKGGIQELRTIYQTAVQTQNPHKLDKFFAKLQIPQNVILDYALAKVQLNEMQQENPAQAQAILSRLEAENRAEELAQQREQATQNAITQEQRANFLQTDFILQQPEVSALAQEFNSRFPKEENAFRARVIEEGRLAYALSQGRVKLTPQQAINSVIEKFALKTSPLVPQSQAAASVPAKKAAPAAPAKRTVATLPNVQGRSTSPLKQPKPRSIEDLKKISRDMYGS